MCKLEDFRKLARDYEKVADFVVVYLREAHATDEWRIKNNRYSIRIHRNMQERFAAARMLHQMALPCPLLVDTMQDEAAALFRALPERLVVICDGTLICEGKRGPAGYCLNDVRNCLMTYLKE